MAKLKQSNITQGMFYAVNLQAQIINGSFEWTMEYLINKMDMSLFERNYCNDEHGAAAYPPRALLKLTFFCYSRGIITSRKIEKTARENLVAKALAEDFEPDYDTIATFISTNSEAVTDLFTQVLMQCEKLKLIGGEMFAIDGCKLPSNASKEWSGTIEELIKKRDKLKQYISRLMQQHTEMDKDEKAKKRLKTFKKTMGDDKERHARSVERLEKKLQKLNEFLEKAEPRKGMSKDEVKSNITDNESAFIKGPHGFIQGYNGIAIADSTNQVIICAEAIGSGPESGCFPEMLDSLEENMKTVTGKEKPLEKALVAGDSGFFTEDNLQEAAKRSVQVLIPDPQFRQRDAYFAEKKEEKVVKQKKKFSSEDFIYNEEEDSFTCPSGKTLEYKCDVELRNNTGRQYKAKIVDCRNCKLAGECIMKRGKNETTVKTPRTLYIPYMKYEKNLSEEMKHKIDDPVNRELYSRRMQIVEPVFANITHHKGMDRFTLRMQEKVNIQWKMFCIVHNIWKCAVPLALKLKIKSGLGLI